jgi:hypothetical protein
MEAYNTLFNSAALLARLLVGQENSKKSAQMMISASAFSESALKNCGSILEMNKNNIP